MKKIAFKLSGYKSSCVRDPQDKRNLNELIVRGQLIT